MKNIVMYAYNKYRLLTFEDEKNKQRGKQYCDGSMQMYLEECWNQEDESVVKNIIDKLNKDLGIN